MFAYMRTSGANPAFGGAATFAALWSALAVRLRMTKQPAATEASAFAQPTARQVGRSRISLLPTLADVRSTHRRESCSVHD